MDVVSVSIPFLGLVWLVLKLYLASIVLFSPIIGLTVLLKILSR